MYNIFLFFLLIIWSFNFLTFLFTNKLRLKFLYFFLTLTYFIFWGFYYNLDGIMLLFILAEFMLLFIFFLIYTQIYVRVNSSIRISYKIVLQILTTSVLLLLIQNISHNNTYVTLNYYSSLHWIVSADFFFIYYFFFINYPLIIIFLGCILGLFSTFFIFLYFKLKQLQNAKNVTSTKLNFIRKQQLTRQAVYKANLRTFQKN